MNVASHSWNNFYWLISRPLITNVLHNPTAHTVFPESWCLVIGLILIPTLVQSSVLCGWSKGRKGLKNLAWRFRFQTLPSAEVTAPLGLHSQLGVITHQAFWGSRLRCACFRYLASTESPARSGVDVSRWLTSGDVLESPEVRQWLFLHSSKIRPASTYSTSRIFSIVSSVRSLALSPRRFRHCSIDNIKSPLLAVRAPALKRPAKPVTDFATSRISTKILSGSVMTKSSRVADKILFCSYPAIRWLLPRGNHRIQLYLYFIKTLNNDKGLLMYKRVIQMTQKYKRIINTYPQGTLKSEYYLSHRPVIPSSDIDKKLESSTMELWTAELPSVCTLPHDPSEGLYIKQATPLTGVILLEGRKFAFSHVARRYYGAARISGLNVQVVVKSARRKTIVLRTYVKRNAVFTTEPLKIRNRILQYHASFARC